MVRENEISTQFGFEIYELIPMKGVYQIKTNEGIKCLKKINYGTRKLMYLYMAKEHIIKNGFKRIDRYILTPEGAPYAIVNDDIYVVTEWIEGRESDFKDIDDVKLASETLAQFHLSARGFVPDETLKFRDDLGKLPNTLEKRMLTLNKMRDIARKNKRKTEFDILYLSNVDFFMKLAQRAVKQLDMESYNAICDEAIKERVLCHHDYTYHNIIIGSDNTPNIVDFDYCKSELQIYDVSTILVKTLKRVDWNIDCARLILDSYGGIKPISEAEKKVLKTLLVFPQRFWRLANRYYYREAGWSQTTFIKKMNEIINEKENYMNFLSHLEDLMK